MMFMIFRSINHFADDRSVKIIFFFQLSQTGIFMDDKNIAAQKLYTSLDAFQVGYFALIFGE